MVPVGVCDVTGHCVCVAHGVASWLVWWGATLWTWGDEGVSRVHTLAITLDVQEPRTGWEHLGRTEIHIHTNKPTHTFVIIVTSLTKRIHDFWSKPPT